MITQMRKNKRKVYRYECGERLYMIVPSGIRGLVVLSCYNRITNALEYSERFGTVEHAERAMSKLCGGVPTRI